MIVNLLTFNLGLSATLREQPWPLATLREQPPNFQPPNLLTFLPSITFLHLRNTSDI
ncbi:MAG: hypothetical protein F6K55_41360 [Moorea sp. SIO4A3]|nr:hypothetical protein [Moorena sp. SIO4A3]